MNYQTANVWLADLEAAVLDRLVNLIFSWNRLREAIFAEVHFYDMIDSRIKNDIPEHNTALWCEQDGWRTKSFNANKNRFYFNDIPQDSLIDAMDYILELDEN